MGDVVLMVVFGSLGVIIMFLGFLIGYWLGWSNGIRKK